MGDSPPFLRTKSSFSKDMSMRSYLTSTPECPHSGLMPRCVHMYVCVCVCAQWPNAKVCTYVCMYVCTCMYVCMYVRMYVRICVWIVA